MVNSYTSSGRLFHNYMGIIYPYSVTTPLNNSLVVTWTKIPADVRVSLEPYMMEAGIEPEFICVDPRMVVQGLMWYFIINKRKLELNDIANERYSICLYSTYLYRMY